jgi:hypothetical protein
MGRTLKRLSTLKKLKHFGGLKRPGKLILVFLTYSDFYYLLINFFDDSVKDSTSTQRPNFKAF